MVRRVSEQQGTIGTHELDGSTLRLFLTTQLEAEQLSETQQKGYKSSMRRTVCIV